MSDLKSESRLLIVGNPEPTHVGAHLQAAGESLGIPSLICDTRLASAGSPFLRKWSWWFRDHQPPRFGWFGRHVLDCCRKFRPTCLIATGLAPVEAEILEAIGRLGILRLNFLTDDPWNRAHRCGWFLTSLPEYDRVFSPRRSNLNDLLQAGCRSAEYLPFAYNPNLHFPQAPEDPEERDRLSSDVLFVGGADADRVPFAEALLGAGYRVALYGGYWHRHRSLCAAARGQTGPEILRKAVSCAKVCLCLVRRANRDGHVMRSFETPATRATLLVEDTPEHQEIFGQDGESVLYFDTTRKMVEGVRRLLMDETLRRRLAENAFRRIVSAPNTYKDRLVTMLSSVPRMAGMNAIQGIHRSSHAL